MRSPLGVKHLNIDIVRRELGPILADENVRKIGQNIKYDLLVLRNAQMPLGGVYFDTMVASYCLDPERTSHSLDNMARDFLNYEGVPIEALIGSRTAGAWIVLDEVQKVPALLDEVHRLMEAKRWRFALCGSSMIQTG